MQRRRGAPARPPVRARDAGRRGARNSQSPPADTAELWGARYRSDRLTRPPTVLNSETPLATEPPALAEAAIPPPAAPITLVDGWPEATPFALTGWFERNRFTPGWTAALALVAAWIVFQLIANVGVVATVLADLIGPGAEGAPTAEALLAAITEHAQAVLVWNSVGQFVGFGLFTWLLARLSTSRPVPFLRVGRVDGIGLLLAAAGWAALYPVILVLMQLNSLVPLPEWFREAAAARDQMLESFLLGGTLSPAFLFVTVAVVPAVLEEVLFRGYLMRQAERRLSPAWTFAVVGLAFGAYHLSATQVVPLSVLGAYLCFVVWATGSLWSGVLVHLLNNGLAVAASAYAVSAGVDPDTVGEMGGAWYVGALAAAVGAVCVVAIGRVLVARREAATGGRPDAAPLSVPAAAPVAVPS